MDITARLLAAGNHSQTIDDSARQRSAAEYICRELREADEPNLLHEEDMHVYGESPMSDPLRLVCCNICNKPIKDSQFTAHAALCRSLKFTVQTSVELDGSKGNRKPPRKEKKKLPTSCSNQATIVGEQRRSETMDNIDAAVSQLHFNSKIRVTPSLNEIKGHSTCVDATSAMDGAGISAGNRDHPASEMHPPTKRQKLIERTHLPLLESHGTESGVTKTVILTDGIKSKDLRERTISEHGEPNRKNLGQVHEHYQHPVNNDFPAPLATKTYYSQRTNRLRAALRHLYFQNSSEELCTGVMGPKTSEAEMGACQISSPGGSQISSPGGTFYQSDNVLTKESHSPTLCPAQNSGHILAKSSEVSLLNSGALPSGALSNQVLVDNLSKSTATPAGLTRSNFLPESYSFAGNTGNSLGTIQQQNGSVPVI